MVALAGGLLIGFSVVLLMLANARIAGISGIVGGLFGGEAGWRLLFVTVLVAGPFAATLCGAPLRRSASMPRLRRSSLFGSIDCGFLRVVELLLVEDDRTEE